MYVHQINESQQIQLAQQILASTAICALRQFHIQTYVYSIHKHLNSLYQKG